MQGCTLIYGGLGQSLQKGQAPSREPASLSNNCGTVLVATLPVAYTLQSFDVFPYDTEALMERGELVPRSMVAGRKLGEVLEDLSEEGDEEV